MGFHEQPFEIDGDLAFVLCEQLEGYVMMTEEMPGLPEDWVLAKLKEVFDAQDLALLINDDFGRGVVCGQLVNLWISEQILLAEDDDNDGNTEA